MSQIEFSWLFEFVDAASSAGARQGFEKSACARLAWAEQKGHLALELAADFSLALQDLPLTASHETFSKALALFLGGRSADVRAEALNSVPSARAKALQKALSAHQGKGSILEVAQDFWRDMAKCYGSLMIDISRAP